MGSEVCELVGLYLLSQLQHLDIYVALHTDYELAAHGAITQNTEKMKKEICKTKYNNIIEGNKKSSTSWIPPST